MYERILEALALDHERGGLTSALLADHSERPVHDAVPLRLVGAVHLAVLRGAVPHLARHYPSVGGSPDQDLCEDFLTALDELAPFIAEQLSRQVQTNEVGRSIVPLALVNWLGSRGTTEIDWLEIGASAGLNLCFDSYGARTPTGHMGDPSSPVVFGTEWFDRAPPVSLRTPLVVGRMATDLSPIDIHDEHEALRLTSFVWPDQIDRMARLRDAIEIARSRGVRVRALPADRAIVETLGDRLERTTVVFHSIVWQYLGDQVQEGFRDSLHRLGGDASPDRQLIWARMEPAGPMADVQVDVWDGTGAPSRRRLATVGYHGRGLRWEDG